MQAYDRYKDSGIEWLGEIPEHWESRKLGNLLTPYSVKNKPDLPLLSITREKGVILRGDDIEEDNHNFIPDDLSNYKHLKKGQFGMNKMKAWQGSYGYSNYEGIVSPAYYIFDIDNALFGEYFSKTIRSKAYIPFFIQASDGVRIGQWDLSKSRMKEIPFYVPPLPEQQAIAAFLDDKCGKIDEAVRIKQQQIEKLKELRQITIHNAVTKGINADAKMKDSGIDWIGEIPKHWEVKRLKNLIQDLEGGVSVNASESESASDNEIGVLKTSSVYQYKFDSTQNKKVLEYDLKRVACPVRKGAIIISRMNAPELVGASGLVRENHSNLFLPDRLWQTIYVSDISFDASWLSNILISKGFRDYMITFANGSSPSMKNISKSDFLNIFIPFPNVPEQKALVTYLQEKTSKIDQAIALKTEQIAKLNEYKQSLINEVVTGKTKVPN